MFKIGDRVKIVQPAVDISSVSFDHRYDGAVGVICMQHSEVKTAFQLDGINRWRNETMLQKENLIKSNFTFN